MYWFERQIDVIVKMTGKRPRGWRAPLYNYSKHSTDFMIEQNFLYDASLMGDDVPYVLKTKKGQVIELPSQKEARALERVSFVYQFKKGKKPPTLEIFR